MGNNPSGKTPPIPAQNLLVTAFGRKIGQKPARNVRRQQSGRKNTPYSRAHRENVPASNTFPGQKLPQQDKTKKPPEIPRAIYLESYDMFNEYLHAYDYEDYASPDFGFLAGLVAQFAAALQTNEGCNCSSNKSHQSSKAYLLQRNVQHR